MSGYLTVQCKVIVCKFSLTRALEGKGEQSLRLVSFRLPLDWNPHEPSPLPSNLSPFSYHSGILNDLVLENHYFFELPRAIFNIE